MSFATNLGIQTHLFVEDDIKSVKFCFGKTCLDYEGKRDPTPNYLWYPYLSTSSGYNYREVKQDFIPEIEVFCILFRTFVDTRFYEV